ncbi:MAG: hypothetical protein ABUL60_18585 [Myxococcales bacterium]
MSLKPMLVKATAGIGAAALLATAVIGVAHTPWGRPLLRLPLLSALAQHAGCPVGSIEPVAFEKVRRTKLAGEVGAATAGAHPALGFTLGQTRRSGVEAWIAAHGASCKAGLVASVLECENVTAAGSAPISHLRLQFDGEERLVAVDLFRQSSDDQALVERFQELGRELDASVGPATSSVGTPTLAFMKQSPLQTIVRSYGYRDYVASAMLVNLGKRGLRLREQYQWLAPRAPA